MNLQYKWDVYLLIAWFNTPELRMYKLRLHFLEKYNVTLEDCAALYRFPHEYICKSVQVQPWICHKLYEISKVLFNKDMSDVFDMANELKTSSYGSNITKNETISRDEKNDLRKTRYARQTVAKQTQEYHDNWEAHKLSNQWGITK